MIFFSTLPVILLKSEFSFIHLNKSLRISSSCMCCDGLQVLHDGKLAEMRTGEGKTLVAVLPAYLNALEGKGVHVSRKTHLMPYSNRKLLKFLPLSPTTSQLVANSSDDTQGKCSFEHICLSYRL